MKTLPRLQESNKHHMTNVLDGNVFLLRIATRTCPWIVQLKDQNMTRECMPFDLDEELRLLISHRAIAN